MKSTDLAKLEEQCIQDWEPPCVAACPVHVDIRGVVRAVRDGAFATGRNLFAKATPFVRVVSEFCDAPCQRACHRAAIDQAIGVRELERVCVRLGAVPPAGPSRAAKTQTVVVIGGGLCGLSAAFDLARKGYAVKLYERGSEIGGRLLTGRVAAARTALAADLEPLARLPVSIRLDRSVDLAEVVSTESVAALLDLSACDAVLVATGTADSSTPGVPVEANRAEGLETFATDLPGVFLAGDVRGADSPASWSSIAAISEGRRAATSIERFLQKVSLTYGRSLEGPYETRLFTDLSGVSPESPATMADAARGFDPDEARAEAERCLLCACLECLKVCPYLEKHGSYPRVYARRVYNNLTVTKGNRTANRFINSCSLCGLCAEVCPTDLNMAPVCLEARRTMVAQGKMPPSVHDFALEELRRANSEGCTLLRHAPGWQKSTHVFMPGCQLAASRPDSVAILYARLRERLGPEVGLMLRCCGAPAEWAGREDLLEASLVTLREGVQKMGNPTVVVACPTCADILERRAPDVTSVSLYEVLAAGAGASSTVPATSRATLAVHDPCTARHHARTRAAVRDLLAGAGWPVEELPLSGERTECCGFGGLMLYADRELADEVVARRAACSSQPFVTYCAMCRDRYAAAGKPAIHVIDVLLDGAAALESAAALGPGFVERHEARVRLKEELLRDIWGERVGPEHHTEIVVEMDEELRRALEEQLVRLDDVRAVIAHAERSRAFFVDSASGRRLASYRPRAVTYWVQYSPAETGYVLHGVYTHRMEVEGVEGGE